MAPLSPINSVLLCGTYFLFYRIWGGYRYLNGVRNSSFDRIRFRYVHFNRIWSVKHHRNSVVHNLLDRKRLWYMNWYLNDLLHCKQDKTRMLLELSLPSQRQLPFLSTWIWHIFDHWIGLNDSNFNRHWNLHN